MRKSLILFLVLTFSSLINAQMFVGGGIGIRTSIGDYTTYYAESKTTLKNNSISSLSISPILGYTINKSFTTGLQLSVSHSNNHSNQPTSNPLKRTNTTIGISPFLRYYFLEWNNFSVYMQANLNAYKDFGKETYTNNIENLQSSLLFGVGIFPSLQYDINDRFGLYTNLNFLYLGYSFSRIQNGNSEDNKVVGKNHSLDFRGNTDELIKVDGMQIGFFVKI